MHLGRGQVTFGDVVYHPGGALGPRVQQDFQMVILHSGSLELRVDREKLSMLPGTAVLLSPGHRESFQFSREEESRHTWCAIYPEAVPAAMREFLLEARGPIPFEGAMAALLDLAFGSHRDAEGHETLETRYLLDLGLAMFSDFALAAQAGERRARGGDEAVAKVTRFISRELARPLSLSDLARAAGVSNQHLMKLFRDRKLESPTKLLYAKRLEAARDWLSHTGLSVGEIADRCGFANAFHFSRKFRQAHGVSPREWRTKAWGGRSS